MNKKAQFVAILSLFFVLGLIAINYYLVQGTSEVVEMYYTPSAVLKQDSEIKEFFFDLNQKVKYNAFRAFRDLCENSGFYSDECKAWGGRCNPTLNLKENFKSYFIDYFLESEDYDISVEIKNNKFVISGKYNKGKKIFELPGYIKTEVPVEFIYVLDYNVGIFGDLYTNCMVLDCNDLNNKCKVPKNKCSIDENYISMEYDLEDNGFIRPKILFRLSKAKKLEG